LQETVDDDRDM